MFSSRVERLSRGVSCEESLAREESLVRRRSLLGVGVGVSLVARSLLSGGFPRCEGSLSRGIPCEESLKARSLLLRGVSRHKESLVARSL